MTSPLLTLLPRAQVLDVLRQVAVEEQVPAGRVLLVERYAAPLLAAHLDDLSVGRRENGRSLGRPDVDGEVLAVPSPGVQEGILEPAGVHALDRDLDPGGQQVRQVHVLGSEGRLGRLGTQERAEGPGDPGQRVDGRRGNALGHVLGFGRVLVRLVLVRLDDGVVLGAGRLGIVELFERQERPVGLRDSNGDRSTTTCPAPSCRMTCRAFFEVFAGACFEAFFWPWASVRPEPPLFERRGCWPSRGGRVFASVTGAKPKRKPAARAAAGMTDVLRTVGIIPVVRTGRQAEKARRLRYLC